MKRWGFWVIVFFLLASSCAGRCPVGPGMTIPVTPGLTGGLRTGMSSIR